MFLSPATLLVVPGPLVAHWRAPLDCSEQSGRDQWPRAALGLPGVPTRPELHGWQTRVRTA
jgi:hypothetical protein